MTDFCNELDVPLLKQFEIEKSEQIWFTNKDGEYKNHKAKIDFKPQAVEVKLNQRQRLIQLLDKWWWVIPILIIVYDWLTH